MFLNEDLISRLKDRNAFSFVLCFDVGLEYSVLLKVQLMGISFQTLNKKRILCENYV